MWTVYIAQFKDGYYYTGIALDVKRRILQHNKGLGAKSLKGKGPVILRYTEIHETQQEALKREREIKGWRRDKKILLIQKGSV